MEAVREMKSSNAASSSCFESDGRTGGFGRGVPARYGYGAHGATGEGFRRVPLGLVSCGRNWSSNIGDWSKVDETAARRPGDATIDCFDWNATASHKTKWDAKMMENRNEEEMRCVPCPPQSGE